MSDCTSGAFAPPSAWPVIRRLGVRAALVLSVPLAVSAQSQQPSTPPDPDAPITFTETIVVTTPLPGVELPARRVPAPGADRHGS